MKPMAHLRSIQRQPRTFFALPERLLGPLAIFDIGQSSGPFQDISLFISQWHSTGLRATGSSRVCDAELRFRMAGRQSRTRATLPNVVPDRRDEL
jgi:hypothetical protein